MREIKFRAIHPTGGLVYFTLRSIDGYGSIMMDDGFQSLSQCKVSQFTGMHDKNGREVYEDDYLTLANDRFGDKEPFLVKWLDHSAGYGCFSTFSPKNASKISFMAADRMVVAGNLHQNPELQGDEP